MVSFRRVKYNEKRQKLIFIFVELLTFYVMRVRSSSSAGYFLIRPGAEL